MARIGPCSTCVFFAPGNPEQGGHLGNCVRYAPRPILDREDKPRKLFFAEFPVVEAGMGCGEHEYID